jgi:hypothetical protein
MIKNRIRSEWPVVLMLALWLIYLVAEFIAMHGVVSYASDDAYMRMAIGRNVALNGTWGINSGEFASIVGSLVWPLVLGVADKLIGVQVWLPIFINVVLSCILLLALDCAARRALSEPRLRFASVCFVVVSLPLGPLVLEGMEHTLQLLLTLVVVEGALQFLDRKAASWVWWGGAAGLLAATRYEGLFVVGVTALVFVFASRKNVPAAVGLIMVSALPLLIYGWVSFHNGWLPVPNDVYFRRAPLMPDSLAAVWPLLLRPLDLLNQDAVLRAIVLAPLIAIVWHAMAIKQGSDVGQSRMRTLLFVGAIVLHLYFVGLREYRYDAYLVLLGWWAMLPLLQEVADFFHSERISIFSASSAVFATLGVVLLFPLANRGLTETSGWWNAREAFRQNELLAVTYAEQQNWSGGAATDFPGVFSNAGYYVLDLTGMGSANLSRARRYAGIHAMEVAAVTATGHLSRAAVRDPSVRGYLPENWLRKATIATPADNSTEEIVLYEIPSQ